MGITIDPRLHRIVATQPYPLLFATISGAHLYGFPSPDSDFDLRGAHILPLEKVIGLDVRDETVEQSMLVPPDALRKEVISPGGPHPASPPSPAPAGEGQCAEGRALEMDIVSHDVHKFFGLLLKKNGYVLEQLFSPLIVYTTPEHAELKAICSPHPQPLSHPMGEGSAGSSTSPSPRPQEVLSTPQPSPGLRPPSPAPAGEGNGRGGEGGASRTGLSGVITKHHSHHYFGFAETQWKLFDKERPRRVKPLLYVYRVLLTGIHLMRTGEIEANLVTLNEEFQLPYIGDLVARKLAGPEKSQLEDADIAFHESEYQRLREELQAAHDASRLPELPSEETRNALNDLLIRIRMANKA